MNLSEHEKELLRLYRADKRKRRKKILTLTLLTAVVVFIVTVAYNQRNLWFPYLNFHSDETQIIPDTTPPSITLKENGIEIEQGDKIDYNSYLKIATDNTDGEITSSVTFNKIDTKIPGEFLALMFLSRKNQKTKSQSRIRKKHLSVNRYLNSRLTIPHKIKVNKPQLKIHQVYQKKKKLQHNTLCSVMDIQWTMFQVLVQVFLDLPEEVAYAHQYKTMTVSI